MAKEYKYLRNQNYVILGLLILVVLMLFISLISNNKSNKDYDISMMREVGVEDTINLFNSTDTYVLYIGRESCDVCQELLPNLQEAQKENNFITQYLDISKVDRNSDNWSKLAALLDLTTVAPNSSDSKEETYGKLITDKGYTPCVVVISDGKQVAGFFGSKDLTSLEDWLANYGI